MIDWHVWSNSPELRKSVQLLLSDWGRWSQGGWPDLGYPSHEPWTTPPEEERAARYRAAIDVDQAERTEAAVRCLVADLGHERSGKLLVWRYVYGLSGDGLVSAYNRHFGTQDHKSAVLGRLDGAEWIVGCLL